MTLGEADDRALVERLRAGDARAFDAAYARYHGRLYAFLARMVLDRAVAEDLHQETWVRFARGVRELRDGARLASWLFRIARNLATSRARRRAIERGAADVWVEQRRQLDGTGTPHDALEASEQRARLEAGLAALAPADRELILLVAVEGLQPQEAAEVLGIRKEALRKRLERARERLRGLIDEAPPRTLGGPGHE